MIALTAIMVLTSSVPLAHAQIPLPPGLERPENGDMIAWIGDTFVEREPAYGYLETWLLTRFPNRSIRMRNLGWSADVVTCESRARFGSPKDGFEHLMNTLEVVKPSIVVFQYGANDSQAGDAGLEKFKADYRTLVNTVRDKFKPRKIILASPVRPLSLDGPWGNAPAAQKRISLYTHAVAKLAEELKADYLDFTPVTSLGVNSGDELRSMLPALSDNGINYANTGYWSLMNQADKLFSGGAGDSTLKFRLMQDKDAAIIVPFSRNAIAFEFAMKKDATLGDFEIRRVQLPAPVGPKALGDDRQRLAPGWSFQFTGLPEGKYSLEFDGKPVASASATAWAEGITIGQDPDAERVERIRQAVIRKNELFFHRWRPQNETYLLGFRKHEQGNNAVEIPQFDPLVVKLEKEIDELKKPPVHTVRIVRETEAR
jgi:hypothetical protein